MVRISHWPSDRIGRKADHDRDICGPSRYVIWPRRRDPLRSLRGVATVARGAVR